MTSLTQDRMTVAVSLLLPSAATLWLLTRSSTMVPGSYAAFGALVIATTLIALNTWKNGQPTSSVGQLIYEVDVTSSPTVRGTVELTNAERWDAWQRRGEALAHTGRLRALLALSVVATAALLYIWRA
jgi:hypothetical protein